MHPRRILKVALGLLTAVPAVYVVLFAALIARMVLWRASGPPARCDDARADGRSHVGSPVRDGPHRRPRDLLYLFRTDRVPPDQRAKWAIALVVINVAAMPLFFGLHVWPERATPWGRARAG